MTTTETETEISSIIFSVGLPGFPDAHHFVLMNTDLAKPPFSILKSLEDDQIEFVVTTPHLFFPDYSPEIDDATAERIALEKAEDALLLVVLNVGEGIEEITANLLGPIVINTKTNQAIQAILMNQGYEIQTQLFLDEILEVTSEP